MLFEKKKYVNVYTVKPECPFSFTELVAYSWKSLQERYPDNAINAARLMKYSRMARESAEAALSKIAETEVLDEWFIWTKGTEEKLPKKCYWTMYVRSNSSPLSFNFNGIYSYLIHCADKGYQAEFTNRYLSSIFRVDDRTIQRAFATFAKYALARREENGDVSIYEVNPDNFLDKKIEKRSVRFVAAPIVEEIPVESEDNYHDRMIRYHISHIEEEWEMDTEEATEIVDRYDDLPWQEFPDVRGIDFDSIFHYATCGRHPAPRKERFQYFKIRFIERVEDLLCQHGID